MEPKLRIEGVNTFTVWCDSWVNKAYNIIGLQRCKKPPKESPHQNFAQFQTFGICFECRNKGCKYNVAINTYNVSPDYLHKMICHACGRHTISMGFTILFDKLVAGGLLPKNYKPVCCYCFESGYTSPEDVPHEFLDHR